MKKYALLILALALALYSSYGRQSAQSSHECIIGILQTGAHPALDLVRENFKSHLKQVHGEEIRFIEHNGMGQISSLQAAAQSLHASADLQLTLVIGTPALQMMAQIEKSKPVIFAAVTDPSSLALEQQSNVCGVTDGIDPLMQLRVMSDLMPDLKKIAILYSPSESNSVSAVESLKRAASHLNLELMLLGAQTASEIPAIVQLACRSCQLLYIPADNLMAMCLPLITKVATQAGKPVVTGYSTGVDQGAVMALGVDYALSGVAAAKQAQLLLSHQSNPRAIGSETLAPSVRIDSERFEQLQLSNPPMPSMASTLGPSTLGEN